MSMALPLVSKMPPKTVLPSPLTLSLGWGWGWGDSALTDATGSYVWAVKRLFVRESIKITSSNNAFKIQVQSK